jgi:predicted ATPase/class 3 adenylate cyclase
VAGLPTGTVTFLFTDVEGSTQRWDTEPDEMRDALAQHDALLKETISQHDGVVFATGGDGFAVAFARAGQALACAGDAQQALRAAGCLPVRMAVHTGEADERDGDYFGPAVNRAARLMAIGHGGQVLVSHATRQVAGDVDLRDLGDHRLRDLSEPERVFQLVVAGDDAEFPRLRSLDTRTTNLPVQLTTFVGRDEDVRAVTKLLTEHRMVTLTGVGGVGKTRLAQQAAADSVDGYAAGVWLVELAPIDAPRVIDTIARVLDVELRRGVTVADAVLEFVRPRELLLVLDNCEHIVREVRRVADELLRRAPGLSILATSREGLRVAGEYLFSVPSLDADAAAELFLQRAQAADASFTIDGSHARVVADLCARLDGVPLAIELAAARARMFSVDELAQRVEQRFRILTGGRGDVERHQTLRAAIDWSYDLLDEPERRAFARMSVFAGGATLAAIETVLADDDASDDLVIDVVASLVDKSLVQVDRTHAETRYEMLETIRQYAQERLVQSGEAEQVRARHARWFADYARRAGRGLYSPDELEWSERFPAEIDNLQLAAAWAVGAGETDIAMRIGGSFPRQAVIRPLAGTAHLGDVALGVAGADTHPVRARVMAEAAWAAVLRGDEARAFELLERAIADQRAGARFAAASFTYLLTLSARDLAANERRLEMITEGLELAEASGDRVAETGLRCAVASTLAMLLLLDRALPEAERALADARELRLPTLEIAALYSLAQAKFRSDPETAIALLHESIEMGHRYQNESEEGAAWALLAYLEARHGDAREAAEAMRGKVMWEIRNGSLSFGPFYLGSCALGRVGRHDLVALCEGNSRLFVDSKRPFLWDDIHAEEIADSRAALGEEEFERLAAQGSALAPADFNAMLLRELDVTLASLSGDPAQP